MHPETMNLRSRPNAKGSVMKRWQQLFQDETAAGSVEYGLLIAGIALAVIATVLSIGQIVYNNLYIPARQMFP